MWLHAAVALAGDRALRVRVVSAESGAPLAVAEVVTPDGIRHAVNTATGRWQGDALYFDDGRGEMRLTAGMVLEVQVVAAGFAPRTVRLAASGGGRAREVALEPLRWVSSAPSPIEARTRREYDAWVTASSALAAHPTEETWETRRVHRRNTAALAEDWLVYVDATGQDRALAELVCRSTAGDPSRCDP